MNEKNELIDKWYRAKSKRNTRFADRRKKRKDKLEAKAIALQKKLDANQAKKDERKRQDKVDWDAKLARDKAWKNSCSLTFDREKDADGDKLHFYQDMDVSGAALTARYNELNRTSRHMVNGWSEERSGRDMFMVKQVQNLWDATFGLYLRLKWMKEMTIERGAARYNPTTGDFEWMPVPEKTEKVVDKSE
jgi:hypothetical protein